jgi:two-component system phosphate regulon response regulator PhoB
LNGEDTHLTPSEFKLLAELLKAGGKVLTRERLIDLIQGEDVNVTGRTIDTHIFTLRKKIGSWAHHIETIRGVGYRILISLQDKSEPEIL